MPHEPNKTTGPRGDMAAQGYTIFGHLVSATGISQGVDIHPADRAICRGECRITRLLPITRGLSRRHTRPVEAGHCLATRPGIHFHHEDPARLSHQGMQLCALPENGSAKTRHLGDFTDHSHVAKEDRRSDVGPELHHIGTADLKTRRREGLHSDGAIPGIHHGSAVCVHGQAGGNIRNMACIPHPKTTSTPRTVRIIGPQRIYRLWSH